jgi:hypothetical protein
MTSLFAGWTVEDIVGRLSKAEVLACLPKGWIRSTDARKWENLKEAVLLLSDDMKGAIYQAASTKEYLKQEVTCTIKKRKRENLAWSRHTRRRLFEGESECFEII